MVLRNCSLRDQACEIDIECEVVDGREDSLVPFVLEDADLARHQSLEGVEGELADLCLDATA